MNMTEQDWEKVLEEQREAFQALVTGKEEELLKPVETPAKKDNRNQLKEYFAIHKQTPKAKFFVTHETMGEIHGFWCPNAAIVNIDGRYVEIQHWCKIKIIQFV